MNAQIKQTADLLLEIETEMRTLGLWSSEQPDIIRLQSQMPFCYDTLKLYEWLQFIFIPRMIAMIEVNAALPENCSIYPMAAESFKLLSQDTTVLLSLIKKFDLCLSSK